MAFRDRRRAIRFRFVGRFVFAEPQRGDGILRALAIDPTFCQDVASECHQVAMTAPWDCINPLGSCQPDFRLFSSSTVDPDHDLPGRLEQGVWFLDGFDVSIGPLPGGVPDFRWHKKSDLLSFEDLIGQGPTAKLHPDRVNHVGGPTAAIIRVASGIGITGGIPEDLVFTELHMADQGCPDEDCVKSCEMIDVRVTLGPEPFVISLTKEGRARCITLLTQPGADTVVTFSNLCPKTSFESFDAEFASLYEVLATPPMTRFRRVPRTVPDLNGKIDCHSPVSGTY